MTMCYSNGTTFHWLVLQVVRLLEGDIFEADVIWPARSGLVTQVRPLPRPRAARRLTLRHVVAFTSINLCNGIGDWQSLEGYNVEWSKLT
jgi:hypothetical protein